LLSKRETISVGVGVLGLCALTARAEAQEFCVSCAEPAAMYRCIIDGARPGGKQPLQMLCATAMTKEGGHSRCAIKGGTVFDCKGPVRRVSWAAYNDPKGTPSLAPKQQTAVPPPDDPAQPPRTVEEMAKRANQKTAEDLRKANEGFKEQTQSFGEKMTDTTKKTWRCLSSFFTACTE
jgi:hypothetical protein